MESSQPAKRTRTRRTSRLLTVLEELESLQKMPYELLDIIEGYVPRTCVYSRVCAADTDDCPLKEHVCARTHDNVQLCCDRHKMFDCCSSCGKELCRWCTRKCGRGPGFESLIIYGAMHYETIHGPHEACSQRDEFCAECMPIECETCGVYLCSPCPEHGKQKEKASRKQKKEAGQKK